MDTVKLDQTYIANTYGRFPVEIDRGHGATLYDADGKKYIDVGGAIAVNTFGVGDEIWKAAVVSQLDKVQHASNYYYSSPMSRLAEMLCLRTGMKKVFFGNSGAEANECAIKAARKYASDKYGEGARPVIVTLENSFHGRTITTLSATGQAVFHKHFGPFTPGFVHTPANDIAAMRATIESNPVCAVMLEMVQGEGGVVPLTEEFARETARLAAERDILLICDEVQTGNGRTGALYAYQLYGLKPDIVSTAKGLGGGLPIGACLLGEKLENTLGRGSHGSTFGGNPVCCAGALSILSRLDEALLSEVRRKHDLFVRELLSMPGVAGVTGLGLMLGVEIDSDAQEVARQCAQKGLLILTAKKKLRLLPALTITDAEIGEAMDILRSVLTSGTAR